MATLKDHQQAMVDLLASGSGIPASASRLAHAMHDLIDVLCAEPANPTPALKELMNRRKETTPGLNDKALAADVEACQVKLTGAGAKPKADLFDRAIAAERRVKELENTVKQLRTNNAKLRNELSQFRAVITSPESELELMRLTEQAGVRKDDTQACEHDWYDAGVLIENLRCSKCGAHKL